MCQNRPGSRDDYTDTEGEYLAGIEEEPYEALVELPDLVTKSAEDELPN